MNFLDSEVDETFNRLLSTLKNFLSNIELTKTLYNSSQNKTGLLQNFQEQLSTFISKVSDDKTTISDLIPQPKKEKYLPALYPSFCNEPKNVDLDYSSSTYQNKKAVVAESLEKMSLIDVINLQKGRSYFPNFNVQTLDEIISPFEDTVNESDIGFSRSMDVDISNLDGFIQNEILNVINNKLNPLTSTQIETKLEDLISDNESVSQICPETMKKTATGRDCLENLLNNLESERIFHKKNKVSSSSSESSESNLDEQEVEPRGRKPKSEASKKISLGQSLTTSHDDSEDGNYLDLVDGVKKKDQSLASEKAESDVCSSNLTSNQGDSSVGSVTSSVVRKRGRPPKKNKADDSQSAEKSNSRYMGVRLDILNNEKFDDTSLSSERKTRSSLAKERSTKTSNNTQNVVIPKENFEESEPRDKSVPDEKLNQSDDCVIIESSSASSDNDQDNRNDEISVPVKIEEDAKQKESKKEISPKPDNHPVGESDDKTVGTTATTTVKEERNSSDDEGHIVRPKRSTTNYQPKKDNTKETSKPKKSMKNKKRKRVRLQESASEASNNSDSDYEASDLEIIGEENVDDDGEELGSDDRGRKKIRKIMSENKISNLTRKAETEEMSRRRRIEERQKLYNKFEEKAAELNDGKAIVLERDCKTKEVLVKVHEEISCKLKRHQIDAIRFLYDCVIESIEQYKKGHSEGAVLAHCMGLGKTLTTISFVHTLLEHEKFFDMKTCLVLCPVNTVLNWTSELNVWIPDSAPVYVFELVNQSNQIKERINIIDNWKRNGGILVMGYEMYRNLLNVSLKRVKSKDNRDRLLRGLVDPGPDIVVCDEGHLLKNDKSHLSKAVNKIKTRKRIVLTGTPLQNNLVEYWTMINFVKPNLLGTLKEFSNRFSNPIKNGQHSNSTDHDVKLMKKRAHILYKTLDGCVQRRDYHALTSILPPRYEYILKCRLHDLQSKIYMKYLELRPSSTGLRATLFIDYQNLYRVYSHPYCLKMNKLKAVRKSILDDDDDDEEFEEQDGYESPSEDDEDDDNDDLEIINDDGAPPPPPKQMKRSNTSGSVEEISSGDSSSSEAIPQKKTRSQVTITKEETSKMDKLKESWWEEFYQPSHDYNIEIGGKLETLFLILKECSEIGDKVVIFSHSLYSLDLIEHFLYQIDYQWHYDNKKPRPSHDADHEDNTAPAIMQTMSEVLTKPRPDDTLNYKRYYAENEHNTWVRGLDYERIDGSVNAQTRKDYQVRFNRQSDHRFRLFLISTRAGGLGINLTGANRMIIFDVSWNPSHDIQSIFRCYRFGQTKPVYIYRLIAQGTMEEKIYDRQVTKQSLALRVVDEKQIDRHFSENDLQELYSFEPDVYNPERPSKLPNLPKDRLLAELLRNNIHLIAGYHNHDSLLENREDEGLTEEERKDAWREYEAERKAGINVVQQNKHNYVTGDVQTVVPQNRQLSVNELQARQKQLLNLLSQRNSMTELLKITTANLQQITSSVGGDQGQNLASNPNMIQAALIANNLNTLNNRINDLQTEIITRIPKIIPKGVPTNKFYTPVGPSTPQIMINSTTNNNNAQKNLSNSNSMANKVPINPTVTSTAPSQNSSALRYQTISNQIRISRPELTMAQVDNLTMKTMMDEAIAMTIPKPFPQQTPVPMTTPQPTSTINMLMNNINNRLNQETPSAMNSSAGSGNGQKKAKVPSQAGSTLASASLVNSFITNQKQNQGRNN